MIYGFMKERQLFLHVKTFVLPFTCYSTSALKPQIPGMMSHAHMEPNQVAFAQK